MKQKTHWIFALSLPILIIGFVIMSAQAHSAEFAEIEARSHALFKYDETHPYVLPAHELRALSMAIEFGNKSGAEAHVKALESRLKPRQ